jgi:hypothetical protein
MNAFRVLLALMAGLAGAILVLPLVLLVAPCVFVLMATRHLTKWIEPSYVPWQQLIEYDSFVGWKGKAGLKTYHLADDVYTLTTDKEGWRGSGTLAESDIVVFGDSYAFGHAISDRNFFAHVNPRLRVKAIGVNGYNMVQQLMWMKRLSSEVGGKLIVWFVYLGNDLADNLEASMEGYRIPFLKEKPESAEWEIVTRHLSAAPWPSGARNYISAFSERNAKIFVAGSASARIFAACDYLIGEAAKLVRQAGSKLIVVSIPPKDMLSRAGHAKWKLHLSDASSFDINLPDRKLADICAQLDTPFVAGKSFLSLSDYRRFDTHWNEKGNRKISELLDSLHRTFGFNQSSASLVSADPRSMAETTFSEGSTLPPSVD